MIAAFCHIYADTFFIDMPHAAALRHFVHFLHDYAMIPPHC